MRPDALWLHVPKSLSAILVSGTELIYPFARMFRTKPTHRRRPISLLAVLLCACARPAIAQPGEASLQSPRQAVIEMFSGSEEKFRQHLMVEVQQNIGDLLKNAPSGSLNPLQAFTSPTPGQKLESFESGPILFSLNNAQQHQRYEVHIEADDLRGDEDVMELSLHSFRSGIEEEMAARLRLQLGLTLQQSVWRLNTVTVILKLPVGDPRILDRSWWMPRMAANSTTPDQGPAAATDRPRLSPLRAVRLVTLAENLYAQHHPEVGYTCAIGNLVNVGKGLDEIGSYSFLDPEFAGGVYNGYSFTIKGCAGNPAKSFQVVAEPVSGKGKAYCSDDRHDLRSSDDGRGLTCLAAGKIARQ